VSSDDVLEMIALHINVCSKSSMPLLDNLIDNVSVKIAPILNQPLIQFIDIVNACPA